MQNNHRKQDIIQELRGKRQDVTELCTEAEAVDEPHKSTLPFPSKECIYGYD